jgi:hypothetical protein
MEIPEHDLDALRQEVWARIQARSHWLVALTEVAWELTAEFLAAIQAQTDARVRVDCWNIQFIEVDPDAATRTDYGILRLLSWPRAALAPETVQAIFAQHGCDLSLEKTLSTAIIVPAPASQLWHLGEQLKALSAWLQTEDDDAEP